MANGVNSRVNITWDDFKIYLPNYKFDEKQMEFFKNTLESILHNRNTNKVTCFGARCGIGKSTMIHTLMHSCIANFRYEGRDKKYKPEYADKCVCEEWQNYANFKLWYDEHHVFGNRIDLDKDILKPGNKEYSPETCVLIEHYINTIFERHAQDNIYENEDGKYFVGSNRKKVYETYDEVFEFACNKKKERIEKVAEKNLGRIPKCAYDAMLRYDVEALIRRDVIAA